MDVGVIIGRFQVDDLHAGHKALISYVKTRHPNVVIFLGVPPLEGTPKDPLSYQMREQMLRSHIPEATILPLNDVKSDDAWSKNLDRTLGKLYYSAEVKLYCGPDGFKDHYSGEIPIERVKILDEVPKWSGTDIRRRIGDAPLHQQAFRAGIIHATQRPYLNLKMCVDIAIIRDGKVLLGLKPDTYGYWFPGGQVDPTDGSLEFAAKREMYEETTLTCEGEMKYLGSTAIYDWRAEGTGLTYYTAFFITGDHMGGARARDDLNKVEWRDIHEENLIVVPEHQPLLEMLKKEVAYEPNSVNRLV